MHTYHGHMTEDEVAYHSGETFVGTHKGEDSPLRDVSTLTHMMRWRPKVGLHHLPPLEKESSSTMSLHERVEEVDDTNA